VWLTLCLVVNTNKTNENPKFNNEKINNMSKKERIKRCVKRNRFWKTITWRVISWVVSFVIGYGLTGNIAMALSFGFADTIFKTALYWIHEYKWDKITNSKIKSVKLRYMG